MSKGLNNEYLSNIEAHINIKTEVSSNPKQEYAILKNILCRTKLNEKHMCPMFKWSTCNLVGALFLILYNKALVTLFTLMWLRFHTVYLSW